MSEAEKVEQIKERMRKDAEEESRIMQSLLKAKEGELFRLYSFRRVVLFFVVFVVLFVVCGVVPLYVLYMGFVEQTKENVLLLCSPVFLFSVGSVVFMIKTNWLYNSEHKNR